MVLMLSDYHLPFIVEPPQFCSFISRVLRKSFIEQGKEPIFNMFLIHVLMHKADFDCRKPTLKNYIRYFKKLLDKLLSRLKIVK